MSFLLFLLGITSEWRNELEIFCMQGIVVWFSCKRNFCGLCNLCKESLHDKCLGNFLWSLYWEIFCGLCKCKFVVQFVYVICNINVYK